MVRIAKPSLSQARGGTTSTRAADLWRRSGVGLSGMDASTPERVRLSVPLPCLRRGLGLPLALEPGLERYAFAGASLQPRADSR